MKPTILGITTIVFASLALACGAVDGAPMTTPPPLTAGNGAKLNGAKLNGAKLNGAKLNGTNLNGAKLNGTSLAGVTLSGSQLIGSKLDGGKLKGTAMVGAELVGELSDGSTLALRIDAVGQSGDIYYYRLSYDDGSGTRSSLCTDAAGAPASAIALQGTWNEGDGVAGGGSKTYDSTRITFACQGGALAKCTEWGYKPWASVKKCTLLSCSTVSLDGHHQACTRLVRADYCGDGRSWTVDGRPINLFDAVGVQDDTESWLYFEAEWTPKGARCLTTQRVESLKLELTSLGLEGPLPECVLSKVDLLCGARSHFDSGTLLMNEYQGTYLSVDLGL